VTKTIKLNQRPRHGMPDHGVPVRVQLRRLLLEIANRAIEYTSEGNRDDDK
jgi:hypothetical protein